MKITAVGDYSAFKAICAELTGARGPAHVFYGGTDEAGNPNCITALCDGGIYVEASRLLTITVAIVVADFPGAVFSGDNQIICTF